MPSRAPSSPIRIQLLGAPAIDTVVGPLSAGKSFVFAAALYLGLNRGRRIRRDELAMLLWPDASDAKRGERTRWLVRQLRLAGFPIPTNAPELELSASQVVRDVDELIAAPSAAATLALTPAGVLAGYTPRISDRYELWLEERKDATRFEVLGILAGWLDTTRRRNAWTTLAEIARRMLALDESRADAKVALAEAIEEQGRPSAVRGVDAPRALVGRDGVMARLIEGLTPSRGTGHRVSVAGPAGIGKTRIIEELVRVAAAGGIQVAQLRCQRGDAMQPMSLAMELARALLQMRGALGASPDSLQALRCFIGEERWPRGDEGHEARRAGVFVALRDLIGAVTEESGLVVAIDDAQWADRGSLPLLAPALSERSSSVLCWAVTIRAEMPEQAAEIHDAAFPSDDAASERQRELVWLEPLDVASVAQVTAARALPRVIPPEVVDALTERAAGIPFVAEALVDHWLEVGDVSSLPPSVLRLVQSRLGRLDPAAEQLLRVIAVLDLDATLVAAEAVTQLGRRELLAAIERLETSAVVRIEGGSFRAHALWTESALARTPEATRRLLHRYAAQWLEQQELVDPRHSWSVAKQWLAAEDHGEARRALDHAADVLVANGFVAEAAEMLQQAGNRAGRSAVALYLFERSATLWSWVCDRGLQSYDALEEIHRRYDQLAIAIDPAGFNPHHEVESATISLIMNRSASSDSDEMFTRLSRCIVAEQATTLHRMKAFGRLLYWYGQFKLDRITATMMWRGIAGFTPTDEDDAREYEFCAAQYHGPVAEDFDVALSHASRAAAIAIHSDQPWTQRVDVVVGAVAGLYELAGDLDRAISILLDFIAESRRRNDKRARFSAMLSLVGTLLELGCHEEARSFLPEFGWPTAPDLEQDAYDRARAIYWTVCELEAGNAVAARAGPIPLLAAAERVTGMARARVLSIHAHLALLECDDVTARSLVDPLIQCFTGRHRFMDHPALITAICLERFEGWDAAAIFVRRYVNEIRLERWTPRPELQRYLEPPLTTAAAAIGRVEVGALRSLGERQASAS